MSNTSSPAATITPLSEAGNEGVTIREAAPGDLEPLTRLAQLDSARLPVGPMILAEVEGEPRAALSLRTGHAIANPFHRTAELVSMLRMRAEQRRYSGSGGVRLVGRSRWTTRPGAEPIA